MIALGAVLETTLFGTIIIGFLLTIVTLAIVLSKGRFFFRMLPRAFLITCFYYLLMFLIGVKFQFFQNEFTGKLIVYTPLIALLYFASRLWAQPTPPLIGPRHSLLDPQFFSLFLVLPISSQAGSQTGPCREMHEITSTRLGRSLTGGLCPLILTWFSQWHLRDRWRLAI